MGLPTGSSHFQALFDVALQNYERQTGTKLAEHPLAKELETCDSVESVTAVLQKQAQGVSKFRGEDSKAMKSLKRGVHVLFMLSASTALGEGVGTIRREPEDSHGPRFGVFLVSGVYLFVYRLSNLRGQSSLASLYCFPRSKTSMRATTRSSTCSSL